MIPLSKRVPGYFWLWGVLKCSGIPSKAVGHISKPIPNSKEKISHIGIIDKDPRYILHSRPGGVIREKIDIGFWQRNKNADIQQWRIVDCDVLLNVEGKIQTRREHMIDFFYLNNFKHNKDGSLKYNRKGELVGRRYDWRAILSLGKLQNWRHPHCGESIFEVCALVCIIVSPSGIYDPVTSPNEIVASRKIILDFKN